jgi:mevalonate kinase
MKNVYYPSKTMLFGEYSILSGSDALAIPNVRFSGKWQFQEGKKDERLIKFADYLKICDWKELNTVFDHKAMLDDAHSGLVFDSNIPSGYGAGSSGALTAAVYHRYFQAIDGDINRLKSLFSMIENHFHYSSSGIDPLVSYFNRYIRIRNGNKVELITKPENQFVQYSFYLLDSGKSRKTAQFVDIYKKKITNTVFVNQLLKPLINTTDYAIDSFLSGDEIRTFQFFQHISELQFLHLNEMILPELTEIWEQLLDSGYAAMKLCGAGGGGFYLLMTDNKFDHETLREKNISKVLI